MLWSIVLACTSQPQVTTPPAEPSRYDSVTRAAFNQRAPRSPPPRQRLFREREQHLCHLS